MESLPRQYFISRSILLKTLLNLKSNQKLLVALQDKKTNKIIYVVLLLQKKTNC